MKHDADSPLALADGVSREYLLHHGVCPLRLDGNESLVVAAAPNAFLEDALDDLSIAYGRRTIAEPRPLEEIQVLIERLTTAADRAVELERVGDALGDDDFTADVRDLANQPPVVRYVNLIVRDAYDAGASDIHLEATPSGLSV